MLGRAPAQDAFKCTENVAICRNITLTFYAICEEFSLNNIKDKLCMMANNIIIFEFSTNY